MKILILNGPNLNMLGSREPDIYGKETLDEVVGLCKIKGRELGFAIEAKQSNHEGELVDWIQGAKDEYDGLIINAAAYTHTSVAIHDALKLLTIPIIEVHISNPKEREEFRHESLVEPLASAVFAGHGVEGYTMALDKLSEILKS